MSCYNWEHGTITLPAKAWATFRTALIKAHNEQQEALLKDAQAAYKAVKAAIKGKRGNARSTAIEAALDAHCTESTQGWHRYSSREVNYDRKYRLERLVCKREYWNGPITLVAPKRKAMGILPVSKSAALILDEATITLDNATRTVTWDVPENNRAVERANEHPVAVKMWQLLGKVEWTRGSGGQIIGNDEYNRDSYDCGGGGNYVTKTFSKAEQEAERKRLRASRYSWGRLY